MLRKETNSIRRPEGMKMLAHPPRHVVWSTDTVDLSDPFQRKRYIRQVLLHGRTQDIGALDLEEVASLLDDLNLPADVHRLWKAFLETRPYVQG
jgi:hypothetical protein